jgi:pilus assembly protein CpaF
MRYNRHAMTSAVDVEIASADGTRTIKALGGPLITVGRGSDATIVLKHDDVSRKHAAVELLGDNGVMVRDLSTNGTYVDGRRVVGEMPVPFHKPVRMGPFTLRFRPAGTPPLQHGRTLVGEVKPPPPPAPTRQSGNGEQPKIIADGARLTDSVELPPPKKKPQSAPVVVMPRASAPPAVVAKRGGPVVSLRVTPPPPGAPIEFDAPPTNRTPDPLRTPEPRRPPSGVDAPRAPLDAGPTHRQTEDGGPEERDRLKRWLRDRVFEALGVTSPQLHSGDPLQDKAIAARVLAAVDALLDEQADELPPNVDRARLRKELVDELLGLGPLDDLLADGSVAEVMVVDRVTIYVERAGKLLPAGARFSSEDALRGVIERIAATLGRRVDAESPLLDARLPDGTRVHAIVPPLALRGPCLTLRKPPGARPTIHELVSAGTLDQRMARFLLRSVYGRRNIVIAGGAGAGKTTLTDVLAAAIPEDERIVTVEDAGELRLEQPHVVALAARGDEQHSTRELLRHALLLRPDRIIIGDCRGPEALELLQAMASGHDGTLTTVHAGSPPEAVARLESLARAASSDVPTRVLREQLAAAVDLVVQLERFADGTRKVVSVAEVVGLDGDGSMRVEPIFEFQRAPAERGKVAGSFVATGYLPSFIGELITLGLVEDGEYL